MPSTDFSPFHFGIVNTCFGIVSLLQNTDCMPDYFAAGGESGGCRRPFLA
jgi:hypothetical protein